MNTKKLTIIGSGNQLGRSLFVLSKEPSFFPRFALLLIGLGFNNLDVYEDYAEKLPNIKKFNNYVDNLKNEDYDIDLIITSDRIILIVRTAPKNRARLVASLKRIVKY